MPAMLVEEPLSIACVFSDGSRAEFGFDALANPRLARDLLVGLAELIHPHGSVDAAGTVQQYALALRNMVTVLARSGFAGGAGQLTRGRLAEYWMGTTGSREACTRRMLAGFDTVARGLADGVRELVAGRAFNRQPNRFPLPPYGEAEWARLEQMCRTVTDEAFTAHKQALAEAARGAHPAVKGWAADNLRWLLTRVGPVSTTGFGSHVGCSDQMVRTRGGFQEASTQLFVHLDVVIAYRLLFGIYSGIVPDGIDDLVLADIDWAGDASILLSYVKRRTAAESLTLSRRTVRLLEQWLSHSALLRSFASAPLRDQLWLWMRRPGDAVVAGGSIDRVAIQRWVLRHGVTGDDGRPLKVHRGRIRTTHHAMRDRLAWSGSGRATIDPNHSPAVEGDHYLSASTPTQRQAIDAIVEDAQHDLLRRVHPPAVVSDEDAAVLARDYPQLVAGLKLDDTAIAELLGGARDVFTAACADQLAGLYGPKGKPCPARPWICLLCPLAVFAPRHAANLLRLKAFFSRQWQQMPAAHFMAVFGPYATRIHHVLDRFDPAVLAEAGRHVEDPDEQLPLRPEESTA